MIARAGLRWRLVAWVTGVTVTVGAIVFVVVYQQTGSQLRAQTSHDVRGQVLQLSQTLQAIGPEPADVITSRLRRYIGSQPYTEASSLLFAIVPGHGTISNFPELFGARRPDDGESVAEQDRENAQGRALLHESAGLRTAPAPDVGPIRLDTRELTVAGMRIRVGAGESLQTVRRAQHTVARAFALAGAIGLAVALLASYLAGALASRPIRRLASIAARVDGGELTPTITISPRAAPEIRTLAEALHHMLDRLAGAFARQREFVADASHELRTPLTVITGQLELLARSDDPQPHEIRHTQRLVSADVARMSRLVEDMLLLTRADSGDFLRREAIRLRPWLADLWETTTAGRKRRFTLAPIPALVLDADPDRLAQALRNLIDNAITHTDAPDGRVTLATESLPDGLVRFTVADDGPGIAPAQRARVFERFVRGDDGRDRSTGGAGLGLAIVRAIALAHAGTVRVAEPEPGGVGTRLVLELGPAHVDPTPLVTPTIGEMPLAVCEDTEDAGFQAA